MSSFIAVMHALLLELSVYSVLTSGFCNKSSQLYAAIAISPPAKTARTLRSTINLLLAGAVSKGPSVYRVLLLYQVLFQVGGVVKSF